MKALEGFKLRTIGKEHILTPEGIGRVNFNRMIVMNPTAVFLWENISDGREFDAEVLADLLVDKYGIDRELALRDSGNVISKWLEAGIIGE